MRAVVSARSAAILAALLSLATPLARAEPPIVDLGQALVGTVDVFRVEARNVSCDQPQDFRFVAHNMPWLKLNRGNVVRKVERGKTKIFAAQINLARLRPGRYAGQLDIICDTCSLSTLPSCHVAVPRYTIEIEVVAKLPRRDRRIADAGLAAAARRLQAR